MTDEPESASSEQPEARLTMVITLRNGVQIRAGVKEATVRRTKATDELTGIDWTLNDDPYGSSIAWVDFREVVAVHYERAPLKLLVHSGFTITGADSRDR